MHQVIQDIKNGKISVASVPPPLVQPGQVLIANTRSLVSAGTEKAAMELAKKSLVGKARERPDQVRRVLEKLRNEGFFNTLAQVMEKLNEPMPMGYSSTGVVLACGRGVEEFRPGDRVASNGPHAGVVCVSKNLCARVPDAVPDDHAAFTVLAAIALQGVRLAKLSLGETAFVIGLGLVGQLSVSILKAAGCRVIGTDPDPSRCELAARMGADLARPDIEAETIMDATRGLGADAVIIAASTSSNQPVELAGEAVRKKGRVVAVGAVGMNLPRRPYYFKEAEFVVSCSYGPGRYDYWFEEAARDYPQAYVRWTEKANMEAALNLMAEGKLDPSPLVTHRFPAVRAEDAYKLIEEGPEPYLGILLEYEPETEAKRVSVTMKPTPRGKDKVKAGCLGAGNFARLVLLPQIAKEPLLHPKVICSGGGLSAAHAAKRLGFEKAAASEEEVWNDPEVDAVFIITRHDQHASQVIEALRAGKHVFVEKPLALSVEELKQIERTLISAESASLLMVGFNRRFSPSAQKVKRFFEEVRSPLTVSFRMNAGPVPPDTWIQDEEKGGGRIIGEACHAIDLACFLTGSLPVRVFAESVSGENAGPVTQDQAFITIRHQNGSVSNIAYLAGGDKAFPKERVEVFGGGRIAVIEDFSELILCHAGRMKRVKSLRQDKGHRGEIKAFARAAAGKEPLPITWEEIKAVTLASLLAVRSMREGVPFDLQ